MTGSDDGRERPFMPKPPGAPGNGPYLLEYQAGQKYAYCTCSQSARFPVCDGTHRTLSSGITPIKIVADHTRSVAWCACGTSKNTPYCDGSHNRL